MGVSARNIVLLGDQMQLAAADPGRASRSLWRIDARLPARRCWRRFRPIAASSSPTAGACTGRLPLHLGRGVRRASWSLRRRLTRTRRWCSAPARIQRCANRDRVPAGGARRSLATLPGGGRGDTRRSSIACSGSAIATRRRASHAIGVQDILVVAPYNVQVNLLKRSLPAGARVGTIDKFQGQEAGGGAHLDDDFERAITCLGISSFCTTRTG